MIAWLRRGEPLALTTTAKVKTYLGITASTDDALIATLVLAAQAKIERFCNRKFDSATFTEYYDGNNQPSIVLTNPPIDSITSVGFLASSTTYTTIDATSYVFDTESGIVELLGGVRVLWELGGDVRTFCVFPKGTNAVKVVYVGGYSTIPYDLEHATNELVGLMYGGSAAVRQARLTGLQSESLGYESRTWANAAEEFDWMASRFGDWRRRAV